MFKWIQHVASNNDVWQTGADPGFSEGGFGQTPTYIIQLLLLFNKSFFSHKKKYD